MAKYSQIQHSIQDQVSLEIFPVVSRTQSIYNPTALEIQSTSNINTCSFFDFKLKANPYLLKRNPFYESIGALSSFRFSGLPGLPGLPGPMVPLPSAGEGDLRRKRRRKGESGWYKGAPTTQHLKCQRPPYGWLN